MAKLYLEGIFSEISSSPSTVNIVIPYSPQEHKILNGLMTSDVSFSAQNTWGPIVNDLTNLQDFGSMMGSDSLFSWIGASTMCWKGTKPLSIGFSFYLINYSQTQEDFKEPLKYLVKLGALNKSSQDFANGLRVTVHGGYAADLLSSNKEYFDGNKAFKDSSALDLSSYSGLVDADLSPGTVSVVFGNKLKVKELLLQKIDVTPSVVEVADSSGNNRKPLYYKVDVAFTGVRPLLTTDVDDMF